MRRFDIGLLSLALLAASVLVACGGGTQSTSSRPLTNPGTVYVTGSDAPLASIVGFQVTLQSITLSDGTSTVSVLSQPTTVDFARLLGLRTLLALNQVAPGTYTSATLTLSSPVISYLDTAANPPTVSTINGYFGTTGTMTTTVTVALNPNLVVGESGLGGLHMHFNLRDSILTDGSGQVTGNVAPQIQLRVLQSGDDDRHVDELIGGVVSVNTNANTFLMQLPHGRQITVGANSQTQWSGEGSNTWALGALQPNYTVEVSGVIQADGTLLADAVEIESIDKFFLGGIVLQVVPPTGSANSFTMFVRTEVPDLTNVTVPGTATLNVNSNTNFDIRRFNLPVESFLFNQSMMVVGQRVGVAGTINPDNSLSVKRVALRRQGVQGVPVSGSVQHVGSGDKTGSFQIQNNGMFGLVLGSGAPAQLKVMTSDVTVFKNLPNHLNDIDTTTNHLAMWGLMLKDGSGNPVFVAGYVEKLAN